ncbi:unnamed protein product [Protopolystoma xenopodis]|uniref:Uncharacterized protein n=1 Tax=Protopolystoma xenopodis TaxID=117903 RepID=A0A448WFG0_9PLAT|nr:unnamed protein product [Protopolystoma xenopodis]
MSIAILTPTLQLFKESIAAPKVPSGPGVSSGKKIEAANPVRSALPTKESSKLASSSAIANKQASISSGTKEQTGGNVNTTLPLSTTLSVVSGPPTASSGKEGQKLTVAPASTSTEANTVRPNKAQAQIDKDKDRSLDKPIEKDKMLRDYQEKDRDKKDSAAKKTEISPKNKEETDKPKDHETKCQPQFTRIVVSKLTRNVTKVSLLIIRLYLILILHLTDKSWTLNSHLLMIPMSIF